MNLDRRWAPAAGAIVAAAGLVVIASPLHLLGAILLVLGVVVVSLTAPDYALLAILVLFPVHPLATRVLEVDFGATGSALLIFSSWKEVALAVVIGGQLFRGLAAHPDWRTVRAQLNVVDLIGAVLVLLTVIGLALNPGGLALNQFRLWLFPVGVYVAVRLSGLSIRQFIEVAAVVAVGIGILLVVQSNFFGPGFVSHYWTAGGEIPNTYTANLLDGIRGSGTMASPNEAALALAVWACMLAAAILVLREWRRWHALALGVVLVALAITFSRSGAAGVFAGFVAVVVAAGLTGRLKPRQGLAWLLVAIIAAGSVSTAIYLERGGVALVINTFLTASGDSENPDSSTVAHVASIDNGLKLMEANPLGVGLGNVGPRTDPISGQRPRYVIESYYLTLGATFGWIGLAWAVLLPLAFAVCAVGAIRRGVVLAGSALLGAALAAAVVSILLPTMAEPQISMLPWALAAFAAGPLLRKSLGEPESVTAAA